MEPSRGRVPWLVLSYWIWGGAVLLGNVPLFAEAPAESSPWRFSGDFRARLEADWNSRTADGRDRDDRNRFRIRARLAVGFEPRKHLHLGLRLRTGSNASHQSPHVTLVDFDDNDTGDGHVNLDRWFLRFRSDRGTLWAGRNSLPFWKQNEMFWDDDVTPAGLGASRRLDLERGTLELQGGVFLAPVGLKDFTGRLAIAQGVWRSDGLTAAAGVLHIAADRDDPDAFRLLSGNGFRDYRLLTASLQLRLPAAGRHVVLGLDGITNLESYDSTDPDPFTARHHDDTEGVVFSVRWDRPGWAYTYAHIEALAVHASYAEDDWMRWGSAVETRGSHFRGHELRYVHPLKTPTLKGKARFVVRWFRVEALDGPEDGSRFRIDFDFSF